MTDRVCSNHWRFTQLIHRKFLKPEEKSSVQKFPLQLPLSYSRIFKLRRKNRTNFCLYKICRKFFCNILKFVLPLQQIKLICKKL